MVCRYSRKSDLKPSDKSFVEMIGGGWDRRTQLQRVRQERMGFGSCGGDGRVSPVLYRTDSAQEHDTRVQDVQDLQRVRCEHAVVPIPWLKKRSRKQEVLGLQLCPGDGCIRQRDLATLRLREVEGTGPKTAALPPPNPGDPGAVTGARRRIPAPGAPALAMVSAVGGVIAGARATAWSPRGRCRWVGAARTNARVALPRSLRGGPLAAAGLIAENAVWTPLLAWGAANATALVRRCRKHFWCWCWWRCCGCGCCCIVC